ncbi:MAG: hypothetical protein OXB93_00825 [Cytophagales bacterium]|nr:hypothetical protein [Cytophagales bacterium]
MFSCNSPADETPFVEDQYGTALVEDLKKIFGDAVEDGSVQKYVAKKVKTDKSEEGDLSGWKDKYKLTLVTAKEKRTVGDKELPVVTFSATLPDGIQEGHKQVAPTSGAYALGEKTGDVIPVTRFSGSVVDDKFKDGKLKVNTDGSLVLSYEIAGAAAAARTEGTPNAKWEFTLAKE